MEEKLKSILRRIHWSSLLKAAVFSVAWFFLPFWLFLPVVLYLYFYPWFRVERLISPFFALVILAGITGGGFFMAVIFGAIFYLILLIKDLLIVGRESWYEILVLSLAILFIRRFYAGFDGGASGAAFFSALVIGGLIAIVFNNFISTSLADKPAQRNAVGVINKRNERLVRGASIWLLFLLLTQILMAGLFMPLDFIYQSVVVFLVSVLLIDLLSERLIVGLSRNKILATASVLGTLFIIILTSARWWL